MNEDSTAETRPTFETPISSLQRMCFLLADANVSVCVCVCSCAVSSQNATCQIKGIKKDYNNLTTSEKQLDFESIQQKINTLSLQSHFSKTHVHAQ